MPGLQLKMRYFTVFIGPVGTASNKSSPSSDPVGEHLLKISFFLAACSAVKPKPFDRRPELRFL